MKVNQHAHRSTAGWFLTALLALNAWTVAANSMLPLPIEALTAKADWVVRVTIREKACRRDERGAIVTRLRAEVHDVWKGTVAGGGITIAQAGGTLGEETVVVPGQAEFSIGEETLLFLKRNDRGEGVVLGARQGKFELWTAPGGERMVRNIFHGGAPEETGSAQALQNRLSNTRLTLDALRQRVSSAAK